MNSVKGINKVYRGINGDDVERLEDIRVTEKDIKYVSTSPNENIALRFAQGRGHLDDMSRNRRGYILEYDISDRDCVILNTSLFGTAFNESDILIDASKAKLIDIQQKHF